MVEGSNLLSNINSCSSYFIQRNFYPFLWTLFSALASQQSLFLLSMQDTAVSFVLWRIALWSISSSCPWVTVWPWDGTSSLYAAFSFLKHSLGCRRKVSAVNSPVKGPSLSLWMQTATHSGALICISAPQGDCNTGSEQHHVSVWLCTLCGRLNFKIYAFFCNPLFIPV